MKLKRLWPWREYQVVHKETGIIIYRIKKSSIWEYWEVTICYVPPNLYKYKTLDCQGLGFSSKEAAWRYIRRWVEQTCPNS